MIWLLQYEILVCTDLNFAKIILPHLFQPSVCWKLFYVLRTAVETFPLLVLGFSPELPAAVWSAAEKTCGDPALLITAVFCVKRPETQTHHRGYKSKKGSGKKG